MTEFDNKFSNDLDLQSTRDLPTNRLWLNKESKAISSRWINFKGWLFFVEDLFKVFFWHEKWSNSNSQNPLNEK